MSIHIFLLYFVFLCIIKYVYFSLINLCVFHFKIFNIVNFQIFYNFDILLRFKFAENLIY